MAPSLEGPTVSLEAAASYEVFGRDDIVEFYETFVDGLLPAEEHVFSQAIPVGARVLDLGVGAGRTAPYLADRASSYVGLDYSPAMIAACRRRFPAAGAETDFVEGDAADLARFPDGSFDAVVFSFNGIDCLHPDDARHRCLREIERVLRPGGVAVISEHNPRALIVRPKPLRGVSLKLATARLVRAVTASLALIRRLGPTRTVWRGHGYYFDTSHPGGTWWHAAVPAHAIAEIESFGFFRVGEIVGYDHPRHARSLLTGWYYYTFEKR